MAAKILLVDIETAPNLAYTWGHYDQNIIAVERDWFILSFAYQWLGEDTVHVRALPNYKGYKARPSDDKALIAELRELLDAADIIVAHNGDSFDIKKINVRILVHNLAPPSPYKTVDTLKVAKKRFKFDSNKLSFLCGVLGIGGKVPTPGFALWKGCMEGDPEAWKLMMEYNAQDVHLLREIYLRLRPWAETHPDVNLYGDRPEPDKDKPLCPSCGSDHTQKRGVYTALSRKYQRWNCQGCGRWFKGALLK